MTPRIEKLNEKKLIGKRLTMSLANNTTNELWQNFMPKRKEISNNVTNDLISMQVYKPTHFADFKPTNEFEKWATVEVTNFDNVPVDMETFSLAGDFTQYLTIKVQVTTQVFFNTFLERGYQVRLTF